MPQVKQLEWNPSGPVGVERWTAKAHVVPEKAAMYELGHHEHGGGYFMSNWRGIDHQIFESVDAARTAAQADYENRILAAIETA